jgi:branched-chain amino acid transport system ATP-binding protein
MLEINNIDVFYGASHIIFGLSLKIEQGETVCLLGRNGTGKTTTMRSIMGLTPPRSGSIKFLNEEISGKQPYEINRIGIGYVPQDRGIMRGLTVRETLELGRKRKGGNGEGQWTLERLYHLFPILSKREKQEAVTLSGGEQQMLTIARTLMGNPKLLLLDEPSGGLAPLLMGELCKQVGELKGTGISILLAEQKLDFALSLANRCHVLEKGRICHHCLPEELTANDEVKKRYLGV